MRNYHIREVMWLDDNEFVCKMDHIHPRYEQLNSQNIAGYGWRRPDKAPGTSFNVYIIGEGQIRKLGTIKEDAVRLTAAR